jgi:hypothetical protein
LSVASEAEPLSSTVPKSIVGAEIFLRITALISSFPVVGSVVGVTDTVDVSVGVLLLVLLDELLSDEFELFEELSDGGDESLAGVGVTSVPVVFGGVGVTEV